MRYFEMELKIRLPFVAGPRAQDARKRAHRIVTQQGFHVIGIDLVAPVPEKKKERALPGSAFAPAAAQTPAPENKPTEDVDAPVVR